MKPQKRQPKRELGRRELELVQRRMLDSVKHGKEEVKKEYVCFLSNLALLAYERVEIGKDKLVPTTVDKWVIIWNRYLSADESLMPKDCQVDVELALGSLNPQALISVIQRVIESI
jgi:hypothetical protein